MCGICGAVISKPLGEKEIAFVKAVFLNMLHFAEERGDKATGIMSTELKDGKRSVWTYKLARASSEAGFEMMKAEWFKAMNGPNYVLGHTRMPTGGDVSDTNNNHPIQSGNVLTMHNGVIHNDDEVFLDLKVVRNGKVDSEAISAMLDAKNADGFTPEGVKEAVAGIEGSLACVCVHLEKKMEILFFADGNPIVGASLPSLGVFLYASTDEILVNGFNFALRQAKIAGDDTGKYRRSKIKEVKDESGFILDVATLHKQRFKVKSKEKEYKYKAWNSCSDSSYNSEKANGYYDRDVYIYGQAAEGDVPEEPQVTEGREFTEEELKHQQLMCVEFEDIYEDNEGFLWQKQSNGKYRRLSEEAMETYYEMYNGDTYGEREYDNGRAYANDFGGA